MASRPRSCHLGVATDHPNPPCSIDGCGCGRRRGGEARRRAERREREAAQEPLDLITNFKVNHDKPCSRCEGSRTRAPGSCCRGFIKTLAIPKKHSRRQKHGYHVITLERPQPNCAINAESRWSRCLGDRGTHKPAGKGQASGRRRGSQRGPGPCAVKSQSGGCPWRRDQFGGLEVVRCMGSSLYTVLHTA